LFLFVDGTPLAVKLGDGWMETALAGITKSGVKNGGGDELREKEGRGGAGGGSGGVEGVVVTSKYVSVRL